MPDIVQQCGGPDRCLLVLAYRYRVVRFTQQRERAAREMIGAESVLKTRMGCAWINEISPAELPDVAKALKNLGVDKIERQLVDSNVVPYRVAQNLESHGPSRSW